MTINSRSFCAYAIAAVASVGAASCFCPPCPTGCAAGPTAAAAAPAAATGDPAAPAAPAADGNRLVIWDGDGTGGSAQSWQSCDQEPKCKAKVSVEAGEGANGSTGLKFHGEGGGWVGMGWNLFGWYPENAGVDLSPYTHLTFQIRVVAKGDPGAPAILLGCSKDKKADSSDAPIEKYEKAFKDGKWHKVSIPISAFRRGAGARFDLASFWEFRLSTWSGAPRSFDIYIDDIAAEKQ